MTPFGQEPAKKAVAGFAVVLESALQREGIAVMPVLVLIGTLLLAGLASPAFSAPLSTDAARRIAIGAAMGLCREQEQSAAQYDRDPFYDGLIGWCFVDQEADLKNKPGACSHLGRALGRFQVVPAKHSMYAHVKNWVEAIRKKRTELGC